MYVAAHRVSTTDQGEHFVARQLRDIERQASRAVSEVGHLAEPHGACGTRRESAVEIS